MLFFIWARRLCQPGPQRCQTSPTRRQERKEGAGSSFCKGRREGAAAARRVLAGSKRGIGSTEKKRQKKTGNRIPDLHPVLRPPLRFNCSQEKSCAFQCCGKQRTPDGNQPSRPLGEGYRSEGAGFTAKPAQLEELVPAASARGSPAGAAAAALASLVAIPAEDRAIAPRLERHCCGLAATGTDHRRTLCRSRTVARSPPLIVLLCLTAILATLGGRITAFLKERLIGSGESEILSTIAASKLNISGHGSPRR